MSAVPTTPAAVRHPSTRLRQARWVLRLHRPALVSWAVLVIVCAALLLWLGGPGTDAAANGWRQYDACGWSGKCTYDQHAILRYKDLYSYLTFALAALPYLVAAWAGAALTGRELESRTAHLAWTQGVTPARWLTAKLALPALAVTTGTSLLVFLHQWGWSAAHGRVDIMASRWDIWTFHTNGPATVALSLAALVAGALAGLVLRRALPALATALVATAGLWGLAQWLMPHLWPAVTRVTGLEQGYGGSSPGLEVDQGLVTRTGGHISEPFCYASTPQDCLRLFEKQGAVGYFRTYHPDAHFWPLQLTTSAFLLALAALLTLAAFLVLRRLTGALRTAGEAAR
ncbi:ABC transporter permease [Streptomyces sp. NPDC005728]|uniref:ABC transporter permease n=1 Tax=Streptomyces sp. NPDC005728 TaxID=3157054 RepID=UPI0033CFEE94